MPFDAAIPVPASLEQEHREGTVPAIREESTAHAEGMDMPSEGAASAVDVAQAVTDGQTDVFHSASPRRFTLQSAITTMQSAWRWPARGASLPDYVRRKCRMKAMGLLFCQLSLALGASISADLLLETRHDLLSDRHGVVAAFWIMVVLAAIFLCGLYEMQNLFPANYVLLGISTLVLAALWSFGGQSNVLFPSEACLHELVLGILLIAVFVSAVSMHLLSYRKFNADVLVHASVFFGWFVGSAAAYACSLVLELHNISIFCATAITFLLLVTAVIDVGPGLAVGDPDSWMRIIISLDAVLLMVLAVPFIVLISGCARACKRQQEEEEQSEAEDERANQAPDS